MIKVLKTDIFRLFRSKAFYVFPIVIALFLALELLFSAVTGEGPTDTTETVETTGQSGYDADSAGQDGITIEINIAPNEQETPDAQNRSYTTFGLKDLFGSLSDGLLLMFLGIEFIIFATCESRNGFIKTAAGCIGNRGWMPVSKILTGIVMLLIHIAEFALLKLFFTLIASLLSGKPLKYLPLPEGDAGRYFGYIMLCILVHIAVLALATLLYEATHNRALGIVIMFILAIGLLGELIKGIVDLIKWAFDILPDFDISRYLLMSNIADGYNAESYHIGITFAISMIYLIGGGIAAIWTARHKDIR